MNEDEDGVIREQRCSERGLAMLRAALIEGEQGGPSTPFDFEAFIARKRRARSRL
jgi:hypothetical protein